MKRKERIELKCADCPKTVHLLPWEAKRFARPEGYICKSCASKRMYWNRPEETKRSIAVAMVEGNRKWSRENPELASERGKAARLAVKMTGAEMRAKQQATIDGDPVRRAAYCEKRRKIAQDFHASMSPEEKAAYVAKVLGARGSSKAEGDFLDTLEALGLRLERSVPITGFVADACDHRAGVVIEYYGDMHHCHPSQFNDPTHFCSWIGRTAGEQWKRDERRVAALKKNGWKVVIVWHSDWIRDPNQCLDRIINACYGDIALFEGHLP